MENYYNNIVKALDYVGAVPNLGKDKNTPKKRPDSTATIPRVAMLVARKEIPINFSRLPAVLSFVRVLPPGPRFLPLPKAPRRRAGPP
jgi:hypothetical protein